MRVCASVPKVSLDLSLAIQRARLEKKLTQKELAQVRSCVRRHLDDGFRARESCMCGMHVQMINEKPSVVNDYESGRAIPIPAMISKIERALGARLPRPAKKK